MYWYQVYAWSSWVQDSVNSPLLAHYLVSFQPMEANSLQSYYLSIFMRIKGTGPCGWMKEWMNNFFFKVKHDETNEILSRCAELEFFCWLLLLPKSLHVHPFSRDLTELRTDITSSAPCIDLKDCLWSLSDFSTIFYMFRSLPSEEISKITKTIGFLMMWWSPGSWISLLYLCELLLSVWALEVQLWGKSLVIPWYRDTHHHRGLALHSSEA